MNIGLVEISFVTPTVCVIIVYGPISGAHSQTLPLLGSRSLPLPCNSSGVCVSQPFGGVWQSWNLDGDAINSGASLPSDQRSIDRGMGEINLTALPIIITHQ